MAELKELSERLKSRFKDVPNVDENDTDEWVRTSMNEHGFSSQASVPIETIPIVLLHAEADGTSQVALRTAYYFMYSDRDETVDKTEVAKNYRQLAKALWERYRIKRAQGVEGIGGAGFSIMTRVDRP